MFKLIPVTHVHTTVDKHPRVLIRDTLQRRRKRALASWNRENIFLKRNINVTDEQTTDFYLMLC